MDWIAEGESTKGREVDYSRAHPPRPRVKASPAFPAEYWGSIIEKQQVGGEGREGWISQEAYWDGVAVHGATGAVSSSLTKHPYLFNVLCLVPTTNWKNIVKVTSLKIDRHPELGLPSLFSPGATYTHGCSADTFGGAIGLNRGGIILEGKSSLEAYSG